MPNIDRGDDGKLQRDINDMPDDVGATGLETLAATASLAVGGRNS